ncbi:MAG: hypothetical protein ACTSPN_16820 [Promethearchaeota archaeon]
MSKNTYIFDEEFIRSKLKQFNSPERISLDHEKFIHSAVIFLIVPHAERSYDLILIRRTKHQKDKEENMILRVINHIKILHKENLWKN